MAVHGMDTPTERPSVFLQLHSLAGIGVQAGSFVAECGDLVGWGFGREVLDG